MKTVKTFKKAETLFVTAAVSALLTLLCLLLCCGKNAPLAALELRAAALFGEGLQGQLWSLWAAQLSLTFLSISVLSILSDKNHVIYWKDLVEERLLSPRFRCFAAYTYYSIAAAIVAFAGVLSCCAVLFLLAFCANVAILILLTDSILDVYFSKARHTKRMLAQLRSAYALAFQIERDRRDTKPYEQIMDDLATQIQRQKDDAQYLREVFELIYNNVELFDTNNTSVQEVMYSQFTSKNGALDLRPFETVVAAAEGWTQKVLSGDTSVVYSADWLFWCAASETWRKSEGFADVHSHGLGIEPLRKLEMLLNRRLAALLACEETIPRDEKRVTWAQDRSFYLQQALFGCYVAIYGMRLHRCYTERAKGGTAYDVNVYRYFPEDPQLLGRLTALICSYNDLETYLHPYCDEVTQRFLSLIPQEAQQ